MERPAGVTILAVLCFLGAALFVFGGYATLTAGTRIARLLSAELGWAGFMAGFIVVEGILQLALAGLSVAVGVGLLGLKSWARILLMVLVALGLTLAAFGCLGALLHFHIVTLILLWVVIAIEIWILYYLFRPHVKQAFGVS